MRIKLLFLFFLFINAFQSSAQYKGGIEIGANLMGAREFTLEGSTIETQNAWGIRLGYVATYDFQNNFYGRGAILINQRGFDFAGERWAVNAMDIPLNIGVNVPLNAKGMKWFVDAGINMEYNFRAFTKVDDELVTLTIGNDPGDINPISFGMNAGTGIQFNEMIRFRISAYQGFSNLLPHGNNIWTNKVLGAAMIFGFPKS